jgi:hypothetical protein
MRGIGLVRRPKARALALLLAAGAGLLVATTVAAPTGVPPTLSGCPVLPADNIWNARVDGLPVHSLSAAYLSSIGLNTGLKADFGAGLFDGGPIGIPFVTVPGSQPRVTVRFDENDESDPGPYPIPTNAPIEGGPSSSGDRHMLVVDRDNCVLYEMGNAVPSADGSWDAFSGAVFPLRSNILRPAGFTSADAAGLPMLPGLARFDEVAAGEIAHALRFTAQRTQRAFVWPARHQASSITDPNVPPMGTRVRLKASYDISQFSAANRVILQGLKTYGMFLADNGSNWFISGVPDERWNNEDLRALLSVRGSNFEVVDDSGLMISPDSGQVGTTPTPPIGLVGDINHDGFVDIRDYGLWRASFGVNGCPNAADLNGDCIVDIRDYGIWRANFGLGSGTAARGGATATPTAAGRMPGPSTTATPPRTLTPAPRRAP